MTVEELRRIIPNAFEVLRSTFIGQNPDAYGGVQIAVPMPPDIALSFEDEADALSIQLVVLSESIFILVQEDAFVTLSIA